MRKIMFCLILFCLTGMLNQTRAQIVNIPDANFKEALLKYHNIDTNGDNEIQVIEAEAFDGKVNITYDGIIDMTGIEAFINISGLECEINEFSKLDVSNCMKLVELRCDTSYNLTEIILPKTDSLKILTCSVTRISSLDISNNINLEYLECGNNELSSLDVSKNINLEYLNCRYNNLLNLDVSKNINLEYLDCWDNKLSSLDVSNNTNLEYLNCAYNNLVSLNINNNRNEILELFVSQYNPELYCIKVDNIEKAMEKTKSYNWYYYKKGWFKDATTTYSTNCSCEISGTAYINNDCLQNGEERILPNQLVKTSPVTFFGRTDTLGQYTIVCDTGKYTVEPVIEHPLLKPLCPEPFQHSVALDSLMADTSGIDFFFESEDCPLLKVDISSTRRRRCFRNNTRIEYTNNGFTDATDVEVHVELPEYVRLISSDYDFQTDDSIHYIFPIGDLLQQQSGRINIIDSVACVDDIRGLTQCTKAWIYPENTCLLALTNTGDKNELTGLELTENNCISDSTANFTLENNSMNTIAASYILYSNNQRANTEQFTLGIHEQLNVLVPANGQTIRLEVLNSMGEIEASLPPVSIEGCGTGGIPTEPGQMNDLPLADEIPEFEMECLTILDSYDPNDKQISPAGYGEQHIVHPDAMLEYTIRFQNTGNDTAYMVKIIDTLPADLDLSSLEWGMSSHEYVLDVKGQGQAVFTFKFNNINLPDSTTNEPASNGFVKFKVRPQKGLPNGTAITNRSYIYFDYNHPVVTNDAQITLSDEIPIADKKLTITQEVTKINATTSIKTLHQDLHIFPNPAKQNIQIQSRTIRFSNDIGISVYDLAGKLINVPYSIGPKAIDVKTNKLAPGIYFIKINRKQHMLGTYKLVKE